MAYSQVTDYGMSRAVGPLAFAKDGDNTLYKPFSEQTARMIDSEAEALVAANYARSIALLREHKDKLHALAEALLDKEVIGTDDLVRILGPKVEPDDAAERLPSPVFNLDAAA